MELFSLEVGGIRTNCYLLKNTATGEGIIVDPGAEPERIMEKLAETGMKPAAILLTHGHFDHIGGVPELHERFGIPYELGEADRELIRDPGQNMSYAYRGAFSVEPDALVREGDELLLAGFRIRVIETPGHTAGSVSYYLPEEGLLFSGDTLFFETFGATHYPTGDRKKLTHSVRHKLLPLPETVRVLPGHGPETTIAHERQYNPLRSPVFS